MDNSTGRDFTGDTSADRTEARIRALGNLRRSAAVQDEVDAITVLLENPEVRAAAEPTSRKPLRVGSPRRRLLTAGLITLACLGVAAPATALTNWLARTGEFGDPSRSTEVDGSEWIDLGAPDAPEIASGAYPEYLTLPERITREDASADVDRIVEKLGSGRAQEGLLVQTYESFALCAWTAEWLHADAASDAERMDRAAAWLGDTANFPAMVANDGGGVTEVLLGIAESARDRDTDAVDWAYDMQSCAQRLEGVEG